MLSREDFERLAIVIRDSRARCLDDDADLWTFTQKVADWLEELSPGFERVRFVTAVTSRR